MSSEDDIRRGNRLVDALSALGIETYVLLGITKPTTELVIDLDAAEAFLEALHILKGLRK